MDPKTKRDNAFQYVVLRPAARLFDKSFLACRADSICKSTNFMRNKKISLELFANIGNYAYLCSVKANVLATPLNAGSKTLSPLLHLKVTFGWLLFFIHLSEDAVELRVSSKSSFDGDCFVSLEYQDLNGITI